MKGKHFLFYLLAFAFCSCELVSQPSDSSENEGSDAVFPVLPEGVSVEYKLSDESEILEKFPICDEPTPHIIDFRQIGSSEGSYSYEGRSYKYRFECSTTVTIGGTGRNIQDWGYVYEDPWGNLSRISLKECGSPHMVNYYVYYRNEKTASARLYAYVKYDSDSDYRYDKPVDYPLNHRGGESCPDESHPHAVDLGLSVKWACCNVGASRPEVYGGYYSWGETEEKSMYNEVTYKYAHCYDRGGWCFDYIGSDISGSESDVAHVKWGGSWRMPTLDEFRELRSNCTSVWTTLNGVRGLKFTSKKNGNSIFLPAAGYRTYYYTGNVGSRGYFWSSSLYSGGPDIAYYLHFDSGFVGTISYDRSYGRSVRPVSE